MAAEQIAQRVIARLQAPTDYHATIERQDGESDADYTARMIALADSSGGRVGVVVFQQVPARAAPPMEGSAESREPLAVLSRWVVPFVV